MIFLAFWASIRYDKHVVMERGCEIFLFSEIANGEVLLRDLASFYTYEEADFDTGNCSLYRYVLKGVKPFLFSDRVVLRGLFLCAQDSLNV